MENETPHRREGTHAKNPLLGIYLLISLVAAITLGSLTYVFYVGDRLNRHYDLAFRNSVVPADPAETQLQQQTKKELVAFQAVQMLLLAICLSVTLAVGLAFRSFVRRRMRDEMELRAANQQLRASEQQLRAGEQELRREKDRFRKYLDVAAVMLVVLDHEQRVVLINKKGCEILGYDEHEIIGRNWLECFVPERLRGQVRAAFEELMAGKTEPIEYYENPVFTRDGRERLISWHNTVLRNEQGVVVDTLSSGEDITERRKAKEALRESLQTSDDIVRTIPSGLFIYQYEAPDRLTLFNGNPEAERLTGIKVKDWIGREFDEIWPGAQESGVTGAFLGPMKTGKTYETEELYYKDERLEGAFRIRAFRLPGDRLAVAFENITEHKRVEDALRKSEEEYRRVVEDQTEFLVRWLPDGTRTFVNDSYCRYFGISRDEAIGTGFFPLIVEDYRDAVRERLNALTPEDPVSTAEHRVTRSDGNVGWTQWTDRAIFDEQGKLVEYQSVGRDVTERKRAEEKISSLSRFPSENPEPVLRVNREGAVLYRNVAAERILERAGCLESDIHKILPDNMKDLVVKALDEGQMLQYLEVTVSDRVYSYTLAPVVDAQYVNLYGRDVTERKKREGELAAYRNQLRSLVSELTIAEDRERKKIASLLHDDVLQKLALSKMRLGMLRETLTSSDQIAVLDGIHDYVSEMFTDMRSLTFDLCPPILYDIGLEAAVRDWLQKEMVDRHGIAVNFETPDKPLHLREDMRVALYRAIREVLMNVIKHANAHKVDVTLANLDDKVRIEVRDDGIGFERARANAGGESSGGMGLFTVRERLEYFGGSLETESAPCKGSRIILTAALTSREAIG